MVRPPVPPGFEAQELLASSLTTTIVRARCREHGEVILKYWNHPLVDPNAIADFDRERRLHEALSPDLSPHPNIVPFVSSSDPDVREPWIATRPGGIPLSHILETRSPSAAESLRIARDILEGLDALHTRKLVHGDLTPRNILVHNGRAALCDLGLAGYGGRQTRSAQIGTPEYMAPELIADPTRPPNAASDVYAAAIVIGELLDGTDLPGRIDHLVYTRAQSFKVQDRPSDAGRFLAELRDVWLPPPLSPTAKTRHWGPIGILGIAILAGVGLVISLWPDTRPSLPQPGTTREPTALRTSTPAITMIGPSHGASIRSPAWVHGTAPPGTDDSIWILTQTEDRPYELRRAAATIRGDGTWSADVDLGWGPCDEGRRFEIIVLAQQDGGSISKAAQRAVDEPSVPLPKIPGGVTRVGSVQVTMTRFQGLNDICPGTSREVESTPIPTE